MIFDDNNQKTQWEKDFKLLAPENWTNGQLKIWRIFSKIGGFFKNVNYGPNFSVSATDRPISQLSWSMDTGHENGTPAKTENSEYLGLSIQFGFVILFSSAFPLAPLFAIILNFLKIRTNAKQLTKYSKRTTPKEFFIFP